MFDSAVIGVLGGTRAAAGNARTLAKAPYAVDSLMVILPVASSVVMPLIVGAPFFR